MKQDSQIAEHDESLSPTKLALLKIHELKQKLADAEGNSREEIAIVSTACRFPRHADTPEAFWNNLCTGADEIGDVPDDRWDPEAYFDTDPDAVGKMYTLRGAFLDDVRGMDAEFFGISPREATWIDPQQRLLLEVCWEALERAGWPADNVGREIGTFVGWMHNDYQNECSDSLLNLNPYIATGSAGSFLCGRLSYQLGLQGPSLAVDTACSSSLVALHLACQSLQLRECDRALVGGVNFMASPKTSILTCKLRALSPHGHSRAFDASADGYVRGEGCGVVALRRLSDARRDGDPILAVIRGSALSHNGFSSGLTAPNPQAQQQVIAAALQQAGIQPSQVDYLEAHGTGTELGDPIEMRAAAAALGKGRDPERPLLVGSVKTNIGHLEAAAGIAGLIKVVLAIQHGRIPPHLHFQEPNPHIPWEQLPVKIVVENTNWPSTGTRIAGVSAFGMSGTNAHVVLESPPEITQESPSETPSVSLPTTVENAPENLGERSCHLLVLSGKADEAVQELARDYRQWLQRHPDVDVADVCHGLAVGRRHFDRRAAMVVDSVEHAHSLLGELERGSVSAQVFRGSATGTPQVAWQFTGQGSQYPGMASQLYHTEPVFRDALNRCDEQLRPLRSGSLLDVMFADEQSIHHTSWTQPALFALEMGLAEMLQSWGLRPDVVMGHSVGQFAAACVAGILSWEDGLRLISERSRLVGDLPGGGSMAAVFAPALDVQQTLAAHPDLSIAAFNGGHTVISGPQPAVLSAVDAFVGQGVRCQKLKTSHAFHSALMDPAAEALERVAETIEFRPPRVPLICNLTGKPLPPDHVLDGNYWRHHLRQPVQFAESIRCLAELDCELLVELGPQPILTGMAASCLSTGQSLECVASLRTETDDTEAVLTAVGKLYARGVTVDLAAMDRGRPHRRLTLPTYPFQRKPYWGAPKPQAAESELGLQHPLLGAKRPLAGVVHETRWENWLAADVPRWLSDHAVFGDVVFPGAGFVEMVLAATAGTRVLESISFEVPLRLAQQSCVQTVLRTGTDQQAALEIHSTTQPSGSWTRNFSAVVSASETNRPADLNLRDIRARCSEPVDVAEFYQGLHGLGLQYGPQFQTIRTLQRGGAEVFASLQPAGDTRGYVVPPMLLDGAFQSLAVGLMQDSESALFLPVGIERLQCFGAVDGEIFSHAEWLDTEGEQRTANVTLVDDAGRVLVNVEKLKLRPVSRAALRQMAGSGPERLMYTLRWQTAVLGEPSHRHDNWLVVNDISETSGGVAAALEQDGQRCVRLHLTENQSEPLFQDGQGEIEAGNSQHWDALLTHYFPAGTDQHLGGVVWLAEPCQNVDQSTADPTATTRRLCCGVLGLLHALRQQKIERLDRGLQIITQNGVAVHDSDRVLAEMSQFWGLGRVVASEHPVMHCRLIDVEDLTSPSASLTSLLLCESRESQLALRAEQQYVSRLVPARPAASQQELVAEKEACYLITGGLGMLGRRTALWLAELGAGHIVLVSRRPPDQAAREIIAEIEQLGAQVVVHQADIAERSDVTRLFDRMAAELPPLKGVIHAAGVLDDGVLTDQSWPRFEKVLAPKKNGALLLHEFTADMTLDFFVLYSSAASVLGSPGQGNYATANAFLDGLAHQRLAAGLPALSVNWGPWNEGMAASETILKGLAQQGITPLTSEESHDVLRRLMESELAQATVLDVDWRRLRQRFAGAVPRMLDEVAPQTASAETAESALWEQLRATPLNDRPRLLTSHVQSELQQILSLVDPPAPETPLAEMGLDSLMAVELSNRLQQQLGAEFTIPPTLAFDYPSVAELSKHLLGLISDLPEDEEEPSVPARTVETQEEVAIIGMSCRFPGADGIDAYWQVLSDGVDTICEIPPDRWDRDKYFDPEPQAGKMYSREGGFLPEIGEFDAGFFGISGQEACWIDPQHRMLLEVSWQALEEAGIATDQLPDRRVGVFMGIMSQDYGKLHDVDDIDAIAGFQGAGLAHSAGVGRVSYLFGFEGPSIAIDTASSSSLVAVCQAAQSLLDGDCNLALAGGANAILTPTNSLLLCQAGMLAPDGRCKSFSAAADGFARGEGCGVVVLKRKSDAERDGDRILALIRGSAVCHNGFSGGLTAPSGRSQEGVIRDALRQAGLKPADVQYLEAHGTGTELGDPIELSAAASALGQGRATDNALLVGSVKANIGHLEAAGGISGLIKAVLAMQHGVIPRQLHFDEPSPHIPWQRIPVRVVTESTDWPDADVRIAGVTALGMSGTNAHVVLSNVPSNGAPPKVEIVEPRSHHLLVLSGKTPESLPRLAGRYRAFFDEYPDTILADACHTAALGRKHFEYRAALVVDSIEQARQLLQALEHGQAAPNLFSGQALRSPQIAWVFTGDRIDSTNSIQELYATQPAVRDAIDRCDETLRELHDRSLREVLLDGKDLSERRSRTGPELFALHMALTQMWQSWGVEPDAVLGFGLGQFAAACVAGVMKWEDGLRLVASRPSVDDPTSAESDILAMLDAFEAVADVVDYFPADRPLICNLTGEIVPVHQLLGGGYWRRHVTEPVRIAQSIGTLARLDGDFVLELGPQRTLGDVAGSHWPGTTPPLLSTTRSGESSTVAALQALARLYVGGSKMDFAAFDQPWHRKKIKLPTYPFQRQRYWITDVAEHGGVRPG